MNQLPPADQARIRTELRHQNEIYDASQRKKLDMNTERQDERRLQASLATDDRQSATKEMAVVRQERKHLAQESRVPVAAPKPGMQDVANLVAKENELALRKGNMLTAEAGMSAQEKSEVRQEAARARKEMPDATSQNIQLAAIESTEAKHGKLQPVTVPPVITSTADQELSLGPKGTSDAENREKNLQESVSAKDESTKAAVKGEAHKQAAEQDALDTLKADMSPEERKAFAKASAKTQEELMKQGVDPDTAEIQGEKAALKDTAPEKAPMLDDIDAAVEKSLPPDQKNSTAKIAESEVKDEETKKDIETANGDVTGDAKKQAETRAAEEKEAHAAAEKERKQQLREEALAQRAEEEAQAATEKQELAQRKQEETAARDEEERLLKEQEQEEKAARDEEERLLKEQEQEEKAARDEENRQLKEEKKAEKEALKEEKRLEKEARKEEKRQLKEDEKAQKLADKQALEEEEMQEEAAGDVLTEEYEVPEETEEDIPEETEEVIPEETEEEAPEETEEEAPDETEEEAPEETEEEPPEEDEVMMEETPEEMVEEGEGSEESEVVSEEAEEEGGDSEESETQTEESVAAPEESETQTEEIPESVAAPEEGDVEEAPVKKLHGVSEAEPATSEVQGAISTEDLSEQTKSLLEPRHISAMPTSAVHNVSPQEEVGISGPKVEIHGPPLHRRGRRHLMEPGKRFEGDTETTDSDYTEDTGARGSPNPTTLDPFRKS